jgi:hypothetical protein
MAQQLPLGQTGRAYPDAQAARGDFDGLDARVRGGGMSAQSEPVPGGGHRLSQPIPFEGGTVPLGLVSDVGSTPCWSHWEFPPVGDNAEAGYWVHDWLYRNPNLFPGVTRRQADAVLQKRHKRDGVGWIKRKIIWLAVRRFGKTAWRKNREGV